MIRLYIKKAYMNKRIDSLYLHFPFCAHLCNYCDFYKKVAVDKDKEYSNYHKYLQDSFDIHQNLIDLHGYCFSKLDTLYIGGGTPSLWGIEGQVFLEEFLKSKNIKLDSNCEFTLEVNPKAWTKEILDSWIKFGANRFSLGIQTLNADLIKYLDRYHSIDDVYETLAFFNDNHLNFSVDFMLGLPESKSNKRNVISELEMALSFGPSHFSVYILTVKDNYPHFKKLPDEEYIEFEYLEVAEFLKSNGFEHYEVSNFAKRDKSSKHNLNYWKSKSVAAFGPSATGFLSHDRIRYKWKPNSPQMDIENLSEDEFKLEQFYMAFRSNKGIDIGLYPKEFELLALDWQKRKLVDIQDRVVRLKSKGYLVLDSLINELFSRHLL
jgi:oxygen-independent coproporphyrinogen-3 oxidase